MSFYPNPNQHLLQANNSFYYVSQSSYPDFAYAIHGTTEVLYSNFVHAVHIITEALYLNFAYIMHAITETIANSIKIEPIFNVFATKFTPVSNKVSSTGKQSCFTKHKIITLVWLCIDFKNNYKATKTGQILFWITITFELQKKINKDLFFTSDSARIKMKDLLDSYRNWKAGIETSGIYNTNIEFEYVIEEWHNYIKRYKEKVLGLKISLEELKTKVAEAEQIKNNMLFNPINQAKAKSKYQMIKK